MLGIEQVSPHGGTNDVELRSFGTDRVAASSLQRCPAPFRLRTESIYASGAHIVRIFIYGNRHGNSSVFSPTLTRVALRELGLTGFLVANFIPFHALVAALRTNGLRVLFLLW